MLDIKFVRENPDAVKENIKKKFQDAKLPLVDEVIEKDAKYRAALKEVEALKAARNKLSKANGPLFGQLKKCTDEAQKAELQAQIDANNAAVKADADKMAELEKEEEALSARIQEIMYSIPQMIDPSVPIGPDDTYNVEAQRFGEPVVPDFPIPYHTEIMESFDGIDMDAAGRVAGNGFYYLLGNIARLHEAVLAYARDFMIDKGFTYVIPPFMMHGNVVQGVMSFPRDGCHDVQDRGRGSVPDRYQRAHHDRPIHRPDPGRGHSAPDPDLLQPLLPQGEGAHGIEERGIYRIHQFEKQEMIVVCRPEESADWYEKLWKNSVELFRSMEIPVRQLNCCSGDLADLKVKSCDIEAWSPASRSTSRSAPAPTWAMHRHAVCTSASRARRQELSGPHPEQHLRGSSAYADRLPGEPPAGRWLRDHPQGAAALHGRPGSYGSHPQKGLSLSFSTKHS